MGSLSPWHLLILLVPFAIGGVGLSLAYVLFRTAVRDGTRAANRDDDRDL